MQNTKKTLRIEPVLHRNERRLKLVFGYDTDLIARVRKIPDARWSRTMGCWHVPDHTKSIDLISQIQNNFGSVHNEKNYSTHHENIKQTAIIEIDEYNQQIFLQFPFHEDLKNEIKKLSGAWWHAGLKRWSVTNNNENLEILQEVFVKYKCPFQIKITKPKANRKAYARKAAPYSRVPKKFINELKLQNKSENTIKHYTTAIAAFLEYFRQKEVSKITVAEIHNYILYFRYTQNYSPAFQNQAISALKLFFKIMYNIDFRSEDLPRPKKSRQLPRVISREEVEALIKQTSNQKHKLILMLLYGGGLRIGEVINLKVEDIDFKRKQIYIYNGKGRRDRSINLTPSLSKHIEKYIKDYSPRCYLFNGQGNIQYSRESVGQIINKAAYKAGIKKKVTPHVLRHCYATHMLEKGVDLRYIQYLLGHKSSKTTEIYTHVSTRKLSELGSPLDDIEL